MDGPYTGSQVGLPSKSSFSCRARLTGQNDKRSVMFMPATNTAAPKLNSMQIETILDRIVPLIAEPADHSFFRGVLAVKFENCTAAQASRLVHKLLT